MTRTAKKSLEFKDVMSLGYFDSGKRWWPNDAVADGLAHLRTPSRSWPNSYLTGAQTQKFAAWLCEARPDLAQKAGLLA